MSLRTIMIFPQFKNMGIIDEIRKQYDPLYGFVAPHITLVFPFEDTMGNDELNRKLEICLLNVSSFKIVLQGVKKHVDVYGNYLFLNVIEGAEALIDIHDALYSGIWGGNAANVNYIPHMTIGKRNSIDELDHAFADVCNMNDIFEAKIEKVSVEMIGDNEESIIMIETYLNR